jgi:hypothetical protein
VTFFTTAQTNTPRTITWTVDDGAAVHHQSAAAVTNIAVQGVIPPPVGSSSPLIDNLNPSSGNTPPETGGSTPSLSALFGNIGDVPGNPTSGISYVTANIQTIVADAGLQIQIPMDSLFAPLAGNVVSIGAQLANGDPLPDWLKFDPQTGKFVADLPNQATAKAYNGLPDDNIVTGAIPPGGGTPGPAPTSTPQAETVTVEVVVRGANGAISILIFTIERTPGRQGFFFDRDWRHQHWAPMTRLAGMAIDRDHAAIADLADRLPSALLSADAIRVDRDSIDGLPAGRLGLSKQLAGIGWRAMQAERQALLDSLNRHAIGR